MKKGIKQSNKFQFVAHYASSVSYFFEYRTTNSRRIIIPTPANNTPGKPKYCSKRGTYFNSNEQYKRDQEGSDKSYPFHMAGSNRKVYVLESPIDCMSHASLSAFHGVDWKWDHRISQGCLADNALQRFLKHYDIKEICFAYDNDVDGRKPVQATQEECDQAIATGDTSGFNCTEAGKIFKLIPYNWGQEAAVANARKYRDLGYTVSIQIPERNDFNADLVTLRHPALQHTSESKTVSDQENDDLEMEMCQ